MVSEPALSMQRQTRTADGLALTWDPVIGAIRYGFIVGVAGVPLPPLATIMKGDAPGFALLGIPVRFTGAVDLGSPVGEERQYGLVAYRGDGSMTPIADVRYWEARSAPRDREYHLLQPPELARPPQSVQIEQTPPLAGTSSAASAREPDAWAALEVASDSAPATTTTATPASPRAQSVDPWDALVATTAPEREEAPFDAPPPPDQVPEVAPLVAAPVPTAPEPLVSPPHAPFVEPQSISAPGVPPVVFAEPVVAPQAPAAEPMPLVEHEAHAAEPEAPAVEPVALVSEPAILHAEPLTQPAEPQVQVIEPQEPAAEPVAMVQPVDQPAPEPVVQPPVEPVVVAEPPVVLESQPVAVPPDTPQHDTQTFPNAALDEDSAADVSVPPLSPLVHAQPAAVAPDVPPEPEEVEPVAAPQAPERVTEPPAAQQAPPPLAVIPETPPDEPHVLPLSATMTPIPAPPVEQPDRVVANDDEPQPKRADGVPLDTLEQADHAAVMEPPVLEDATPAVSAPDTAEQGAAVGVEAGALSVAEAGEATGVLPAAEAHAEAAPAPVSPAAPEDTYTVIAATDEAPPVPALEQHAEAAGAPASTAQPASVLEGGLADAAPRDEAGGRDEEVEPRHAPAEEIAHQPALAGEMEQAVAPAAEAEVVPFVVEAMPAAPEETAPAAPVEVVSAAPAEVDAPPAEPLDAAALAEVTALLDEAELYLLPQWADYGEAARLLDQVAAMAPADARLQDLQAQLRQAQEAGDTPDVDRLLQEAKQSLDTRDYWQAVDLYEQVLAHHQDNDEARQGVARARLLARWSAQMVGAGDDAARLQAVGDEYLEPAPDLAGQSYAAAFKAQPTIVALRGWLLALAHSGEAGAVAETARQGVQALRQSGRVQEDRTQDDALGALQGRAGAGQAADEEAIERLIGVLVAAAQEPQRR